MSMTYDDNDLLYLQSVKQFKNYETLSENNNNNNICDLYSAFHSTQRRFTSVLGAGGLS